MSSGERGRISVEDIQMMQNHIERCLKLYMSKKETVNTLLHQAKVEPVFTEIVWQKLEELNPEFFKAYYTRLILKDQIPRFNELLEKQVEMMNDQTHSCAMTTSVPQVQPMIQEPSQHHAPLHTAPVFEPETTHSPLNNTSTGRGVMGVQHLHNSNTRSGALDGQSMQGPVNSSTTLGGLSNAGSNSMILNMDMSALKFLEQILNHSFSDLTANDSDTHEILENKEQEDAKLDKDVSSFKDFSK